MKWYGGRTEGDGTGTGGGRRETGGGRSGTNTCRGSFTKTLEEKTKSQGGAASHTRHNYLPRRTCGQGRMGAGGDYNNDDEKYKLRSSALSPSVPATTTRTKTDTRRVTHPPERVKTNGVVVMLAVTSDVLFIFLPILFTPPAPHPNSPSPICPKSLLGCYPSPPEARFARA